MEAAIPAPEFHPIDRHFAAFIGSMSGEEPDLMLAAALVSYARSLGHICLDLHALDDLAQSANGLPKLAEGPLPKRAGWIERLRHSAVVGSPGQFRPLILDTAGRLYLHRYWTYEHGLATDLKRRAGQSAAVDPEPLRQGVARLFSGARSTEIDWQMVAAFAALRRRLCVISGGPGTGKTRSVVFILALLLEQAPNLRIALAAPTGKAAARLQDAIKDAKSTLACPAEIKDRLPQEARTIHRLLGVIPDSAQFRHTKENPLPFDVVVVDEASMVDLALMAKLVAAVPEAARLILVGDKDQLASVQPGAALADLCGSTEQRHYSSQFRGELAEWTGAVLVPSPGESAAGAALADCIVELRRNYRFGQESAIGRLSEAVNRAEPDRALIILEEATARAAADLASRQLPAADEVKGRLTDAVLQNFTPCFRTKDPAEALRFFAEFRVLSPLRGGPYGVENLNRLVEEILHEAGLILEIGPFYAGRPVIITRNDYNLKLFNGDIGICLPDPATGQLRAWFPVADGTVRSYPPVRLPTHETAYALTVHKSQGSEFQRVLLIIPSEDTPVLTRELVYTGLTRGSRRVEVWHEPALLKTAIQRKTTRRSGLHDALWSS